MNNKIERVTKIEERCKTVYEPIEVNVFKTTDGSEFKFENDAVWYQRELDKEVEFINLYNDIYLRLIKINSNNVLTEDFQEFIRQQIANEIFSDVEDTNFCDIHLKNKANNGLYFIDYKAEISSYYEGGLGKDIYVNLIPFNVFKNLINNVMEEKLC